jgi:tetraacyldisaccharide 4'-kinase
MREPAFWWRPPGAEAALLGPLASGYGAIAAHRLRRPGARVGIPVLCIGNLTLGGAGKTPAALAIGALLHASGARPYFLTRGYGGRLAGPLIVDPARHEAADVGDEPLLLARVAPTVVARDRLAGAHAARESGAGIIVMDDGFQNPSLAKDLSLLIVDADAGIGNGQVFPAGPLRAPLEEQMARAHALMVIGGPGTGLEPVDMARTRGIRVFQARLVSDPDDMAMLVKQPLLAFGGIGRPEKFFATLTAAGLDVRARRTFADHHRYSASEAAALLAEAKASGLTLVTTEKDHVRLAQPGELAPLAAATRTLRITCVVDDAQGFADLVRRAAAEPSTRASAPSLQDDAAASPRRG